MKAVILLAAYLTCVYGARVSRDGSCGGKKGYTCAKSSFGDCCSKNGECGSTKAYCGKGCNASFGSCTSTVSKAKASSTVKATPTPTPTGTVLQCLNGKSVPYKMSSDAGWSDAIETYNLRLQYTPAIVVLPTTNQHVQDAVVCASQGGMKVQPKSGGHSYASYSTGGQNGSMMISLESFNTVTLDKTTGIAQVGGGVRLGNLADGIYTQGQKALSHGTCPGVGIGGHSTHGGYGHTSRNWGLAMDAIVKADVVLANGTLVTASSTQNTEIYWGIRGAAESLAIVTKFYMQTRDAPSSIVYWGVDTDVWGTKAKFTNAMLHLQDFAKNASVVDNRISFGVYMDGQGTFSVSGAFYGTVNELKTKILPEFTRGLPASTLTVESMSWYDYLIKVSGETTIKEPLTGYDQHDNFFANSLTVPETTGLSSAAIGAYYNYVKQNGASVKYFTIMNLYGGAGSAINKKDESFAAYSDRNSLWVFQNYGTTTSATAASTISFITGLNNAVINAQPQTTFGGYLNYVDPSLTAAAAHKAYYSDAVYARLLTLKKAIDPKNVFWNPQAIGA